MPRRSPDHSRDSSVRRARDLLEYLVEQSRPTTVYTLHQQPDNQGETSETEEPQEDLDLHGIEIPEEEESCSLEEEFFKRVEAPEAEATPPSGTPEGVSPDTHTRNTENQEFSQELQTTYSESYPPYTNSLNSQEDYRLIPFNS